MADDNVYDPGAMRILKGAVRREVSDAFLEGAIAEHEKRVEKADLSFEAWVRATFERMQREIDDLRAIATAPEGSIRFAELDFDSIRDSVGEDGLE